MIVLITGTTSGIGRSLTEHLLKNNFLVIGVDRNINRFIDSKSFFPHILDIKNFIEVNLFIKKLIEKNRVPDFFILNAGVNIYDNEKNFDVEKFKECFDINFYGAMNFVSSIESLKLNKKKIISVSSTSNIIPNPAALGYFSSKLLLKKNFEILNIDSKNRYKTIILSPVESNISRSLKVPKGVSKKIYDFLIIDSQKAAIEISKFMQSDKKTLYLTTKALIFYIVIKIILIFVPKLYSGGRD